MIIKPATGKNLMAPLLLSLFQAINPAQASNEYPLLMMEHIEAASGFGAGSYGAVPNHLGMSTSANTAGKEKTDYALIPGGSTSNGFGHYYAGMNISAEAAGTQGGRSTGEYSAPSTENGPRAWPFARYDQLEADAGAGVSLLDNHPDFSNFRYGGVTGASSSIGTIKASSSGYDWRNLQYDSKPGTGSNGWYGTDGSIEKFQLRLGVAQGQRAASFGDSAIASNFGGGYIVFMVGLEQKRSRNYELGLRTAGENYSASVYYSISEYGKQVDERPGYQNGLTLHQRVNVSRIRMKAVEANARIKIDEKWSLYGRLSRTEGGLYNRVLPLKGVLGVNVKTGQGYSFGAYASFTGKQEQGASGNPAFNGVVSTGTPGYMSLNLSGSMKVGDKGNMSISLENIQEKQYLTRGVAGIPPQGMVFQMRYNRRF